VCNTYLFIRTQLCWTLCGYYFKVNNMSTRGFRNLSGLVMWSKWRKKITWNRTGIGIKRKEICEKSEHMMNGPSGVKSGKERQDMDKSKDWNYGRLDKRLLSCMRTQSKKRRKKMVSTIVIMLSKWLSGYKLYADSTSESIKHFSNTEWCPTSVIKWRLS
jgi:hypothetical protein